MIRKKHLIIPLVLIILTTFVIASCPITQAVKAQDNSSQKTVYIKWNLKLTTVNGRLRLQWDKKSSTDFQGYKVVISQKNKNPIYPENGYLYYLTDISSTAAYIDNSSAYKNGDFGSYLKEGQTYYCSVTYLYKTKKYVVQPIKFVYKGPEATPSTSTNTPILTGKLTDDNFIKLNWTKVSPENFAYYKVVISKNNSKPVYPEDGYLVYFTDVNTTTYTLDTDAGYNGGDFGGVLTEGEEYYFSITAVYSDKKYPSNSVKLIYPGYNPIYIDSEEDGS